MAEHSHCFQWFRMMPGCVWGLIKPNLSPPPHPSSSQNSPFVSYSNRDDFPPFLFSRPISVRRVALSFCTSSPGPAVSQSLYPLSPGVASPRRLGHVLFCLAQVSHIPDIIGRTPVSLADSHLERGGQSLSRQWRTVPSVSGPKHTNKRAPSHQVWPGRGQWWYLVESGYLTSHALCHSAHACTDTHIHTHTHTHGPSYHRMFVEYSS